MTNGTPYNGHCPHCREELYATLPVEPFFTLRQAAAYLGVTLTALRTAL